MSSDEEKKFNEIQETIIELNQRNYELRMELAELQKTETDLSKCKEELEKCEGEREEIRIFYTKTIQTLEGNLQSIRSEKSKKQNAEIAILKEKISSVDAQIAEETKNIKKSNGEIEEMKSLINEFEKSYKKKSANLNALTTKLKNLKYEVRFLRETKRLPMYIEDLESKINIGNVNKKKYEDELADVDKKVEQLHRQSNEIDAKIKSNSDLVDKSKADLESILNEIDQVQEQISKISNSISCSNKRYQELNNESNRIIEEFQNSFDKMESEIATKSEIYNKKNKELSVLEGNLSEMKKDSNTKIDNLSTEIRNQRKRLQNLNDFGFDDEIPRVDKELEEQINNVKAQLEELTDHKTMLKEAIDLAEKEIKEKDNEYLRQIFSTPEQIIKFNNNPEFQQKKLLFEEFLYQNNQLNTQISEMTKKIQLLSKNNEEYWKQFKAKKK